MKDEYKREICPNCGYEDTLSYGEEVKYCDNCDTIINKK